MSRLWRRKPNSRLSASEASTTTSLAVAGERAAERYLLENGYQLICRNWCCAKGELDLIVFEQSVLVFVEVKTRRRTAIAERLVFQNITQRKQRQLRYLATWYLRQQRLRCHFRIDVIGVLMSVDGAEIRHIKNAC